jgi:hypothetical protein
MQSKNIKGTDELVESLKDNPIAKSIILAAKSNDETALRANYAQIETFAKKNTLLENQLAALYFRAELDMLETYNATAKEKGLPQRTQKDVAKAIGVTPQWVSRAFKTVASTQNLRQVLQGKMTLNGQPTKGEQFGRQGPVKGSKPKTQFDRACAHIDSLYKIAVEEHTSGKTDTSTRIRIKEYATEKLSMLFSDVIEATGQEQPITETTDKGATGTPLAHADRQPTQEVTV